MIGTKINLSKAPTDISVASLFIAEYAAWLYGCGATCTRIQKNVERMTSVWNLHLEMNIMPENIQVTVFDSERGQSQVYSKKTPHTGISFYKNTQLSKLSWAVADQKIGLEDAQRAFQKIISAPFTVPWVVLVLTGQYQYYPRNGKGCRDNLLKSSLSIFQSNLLISNSPRQFTKLCILIKTNSSMGCFLTIHLRLSPL